MNERYYCISKQSVLSRITHKWRDRLIFRFRKGGANKNKIVFISAKFVEILGKPVLKRS